MPLVSVIASTFNDSRYILRSLQSVIEQTFSDWEFILINDGSTDATDAVVQTVVKKEPRLRYYPYATNRGVVACVNEALELARGEYIARIGADDEWINPEKLELQVKFLAEHPEHVLLGTWARVIDESGQSLYRMTPAITDENIRRSILSRNQFIDTSVLYRKAAAIKAGKYNPADVSEDYGLFLRLGTIGKLANLPLITVSYLINPTGISQTKAAAQAATAVRLIKQHRDNYPGFWLALLRWQLQRALLKAGGVKLLNMIKRLVN
jgi:glycosyltransferase involved in cell wall biosynthesis